MNYAYKSHLCYLSMYILWSGLTWKNFIVKCHKVSLGTRNQAGIVRVWAYFSIISCIQVRVLVIRKFTIIIIKIMISEYTLHQHTPTRNGGFQNKSQHASVIFNSISIFRKLLMVRLLLTIYNSIFSRLHANICLKFSRAKFLIYNT